MIAITLSACSASARTAGSAAASSPETISSPIGSGFSSSSSEHAAQASATPRAVRRRGQVERAAAGLRVEPEPVAELGQPRAAAAAAAGPDQDRAVRVARRAARASCRASRSGRPRTTSAPLRRACLIQRSTIGARSATCSSPTTTTISASRDRRERRPEGVERVRGRLGQHGRVRAEPLAQQLAERVRLLDRLRAGERGDDPALRAAQQRLGAVERVVPGELARSPRRRDALAAGRRSGRPRRGAGRRSGPCRRASPRRPRDGCARGSA